MRFHTSLPIKDIQQTIEFYTVVFGTPPVKVRSDYAKFLPKHPDVNITFHQVDAERPLLTDLHLGFELPDQSALDAAYERLKAAGWVSEARATSVCCYANQDKFWVTDPNGYRWEFYRVVNDADYKIDGPSGCCATPGPEPSASGCC